MGATHRKYVISPEQQARYRETYNRKRQSARHAGYAIRRRSVDRVWRKLTKGLTVDPLSGCWEVPGVRYPHVTYGGVFTYRHRAMYEECHSVALTPADVVCHRCDNPQCVAPYHLFLGTQADNVEDASRKLRLAQKLTPEAVKQIRARRDLGCHRAARAFGVSVATIKAIRTGRTWKYL